MEEVLTNFGGRFDATFVRGTLRTNSIEYIGVAAFDSGLFNMLREGMLLAVKNFKETYSILVLNRFWPEHMGIQTLRDESMAYDFEAAILEDIRRSWENGKATKFIALRMIPAGYSFDPETMHVEKRIDHPKPGEKILALTDKALKNMFNRPILQRYGENQQHIGSLIIYEGVNAPIYIDYRKLLRYHYGIFGFTGTGKSNLTALLIHRMYHSMPDVGIVVFDITGEYSFLLADLLAKEPKSEILAYDYPESAEELAATLITPIDYDESSIRRRIAEKIYPKYRRMARGLTYFDLIQEAETKGERYRLIVYRIRNAVRRFLAEKELPEEALITPEDFRELKPKLEEVLSPVSDRSAIKSLPDQVEAVLMEEERTERDEVIHEHLRKILRGEMRILLVQASEDVVMRQVVTSACKYALDWKKRHISETTPTLFVLDEAHEYVSAKTETTYGDYSRQASEKVENTLRHGRKYGLGICLSSQRVSYLNTSALQQLHTYFVGPMPRKHDRDRIVEAFAISDDILSRTLELNPGEWLLTSYVATGLRNVPIFFKAENVEDIVVKNLDGTA